MSVGWKSVKQADLEKILFKLQQISQTKKEKLELREVNTVVNEREAILVLEHQRL